MKATLRILVLIALLAALLAACSEDSPVDGGESADTTHYMVPLVVRSIPHMNSQAGEAFTQGLLYHDGLLYESNGTYSESNIRSLDPADGSIVKRVTFRLFNDPGFSCNYRNCFAEGITIKDGRIVQLLFLKRHTYSWSIPDLGYLGVEYNYDGQGWGITTVDTSFVTTHSSDTLYFRDDSFAVTRKLPVTFQGEPLDSLNELEYVDGVIYANVLGREFIYGIDPLSGIAHTAVNCSTLVETVNLPMTEDPLNGIAYDGATGYFYLTGKNWPLIFEVLFTEE